VLQAPVRGATKKFINGETMTLLQNFNKELKIGGIEQDIPEKLQEIFPQETFLYPRNLPGVYVIYFPKFNKVYIGESQNVKKRVTRETKTYSVSASIPLNLYLQQTNFEDKIYALYQGIKCTQKIRKALEKKFIKPSDKNSINILGNANQVYNDLIKYPEIPKLFILPMETTTSWLNYDLPYEKITYNSGDTVIYAIINKDSKRLYIGKTGMYPLINRMKFHHTAIQKVLTLRASGITTSPTAHTKMAEDIEKGQNIFYYSAIRNIYKVSKTQASQIEKSAIAQASCLSKQELYNIYKKNTYSNATIHSTKDISSKHTQAKKIMNGTRVTINPFIINGIWYETALEAISAAGVSNYQTLKLRSESFSFPNIISIKKPVGKALPPTKEIKEKVDEYYRRYGQPTMNGTIITFEKALTQSVSPRFLSPYIYQGKWFDSKQEAAGAAQKQGISFGSFSYRTRSPLHPDVISIRNPYGKKIPNTPEINEKLQQMRRYEESYFKKRPSRKKNK
jgi:hypothetical protein